MMRNYCGILLLLLAGGCARFSTRQVDHSTSYEINGTNITIRTITATSKTTSFFEGRSRIKNYSATQSDKVQKTTVGDIGQEVTSTNLAKIVDAAVEAAVKAAIKSVKPVP